MKFRVSLFLLTLALVPSSTLTAHASVCSNSTVTGTCAFTIHGQVFLPDGPRYSLMASPRLRLMAEGI
jgi:hypothetical protein